MNQYHGQYSGCRGVSKEKHSVSKCMAVVVMLQHAQGQSVGINDWFGDSGTGLSPNCCALSDRDVAKGG